MSLALSVAQKMANSQRDNKQSDHISIQLALRYWTGAHCVCKRSITSCWAVHAGPNDVPSEKGGAGANGYTYFVCNQLGGALSRLPLVKPSHIKAARQVKKFVSGKLETQVSRLLHEETCFSIIAMSEPVTRGQD